MTSNITWIDHDPAARDRALRILSLFQEKDSRDELGLGAVRDSFADQLFPGTSTIQTRLRYMLFIPWIYTSLESARVVAPKFTARARRMETALIVPLLKNEDDAGVFGKTAGDKLKRLPSSVYWNGLGLWGIRQIECSQDEYHRHINSIYSRRERARDSLEDDEDTRVRTRTWHPKLPGPPAGFPDKVTKLSFHLEREEAEYLLERLRFSQKESLLTWLALNGKPAICDFPWEHPQRMCFPDHHQTVLEYAEFFSTLMHGAAYLYNLMLAEQAKRKGLVGFHREALEDWRVRLKACRPAHLPLNGLWAQTEGKGHVITPRTQAFVREWHNRVIAMRGRVTEDKECRLLVKNREKQLKGARSRFENARALDQWTGYAGINPLSYRWPQVQRLLADLYAGLGRGQS